MLVPVNSVDESSSMVTAPAELNVTEPKFIESPDEVPNMMLAPLRFALLVTVRFAVPSLVIPAAELSVRL